MEKYCFTKTLTGTGASISVDCGFTPAYVKVVNITDANSLEFIDTMTAGSAMKQVTGGEFTYISSGGITLSSSTDTFRGFKIGTDAVNTSAKTLHVVAYRN